MHYTEEANGLDAQREFLNSIKIGDSEVQNRPAQEGVLMYVMLRAYPNRVSQGYLLV
jgi:hypothetical protein